MNWQRPLSSVERKQLNSGTELCCVGDETMCNECVKEKTIRNTLGTTFRHAMQTSMGTRLDATRKQNSNLGMGNSFFSKVAL